MVPCACIYTWLKSTAMSCEHFQTLFTQTAVKSWGRCTDRGALLSVFQDEHLFLPYNVSWLQFSYYFFVLWSLFLSSDPVRITWHSSCFSVQIPSSQYARTCVHAHTHRYTHTPHPLTHAHIHAHTWQTHSPCTQTHAIKYSIPSCIITLTHQAHTTHTHSHRHTYTLHATTQAHTDAHHPHTTCIHRMHIYILKHIQHTQQVSTEHPTRHWGYSDEQNRPNFFPTRSLYQEWREKGIWRKYEARIGRKRTMLPLVAEPAAAAVTSED